MKAYFSELKMHSYIIEESAFKTTFTGDDKIQIVKSKIHSRIFNIDFDIFDNKDNNDYFFIDLKIDSFPKTKRKTAGYDFKVRIKADFELYKRDNYEESKQFQYILYSALPMTISLIRSEISHLTANGIYGKYTLPAIDLQKLVNDWFDKNQDNEQKKT